MVRHRLWLALLAGVAVLCTPWTSSPRSAAAQTAVTDAELEQASGRYTVNLGTPSSGRVVRTPLETYVARVIAGEAEPSAPDAAQQAMAIAIRTFAIVNLRRHAKEGFDLCDTTHCQVPRAATPATRRAALATAGRVLVYKGAPATVFYSANCGGRSESADEVWPGINLPYLRPVDDDVHGDDVPWILDLTLEQIQSALRAVGFNGERLSGLAIDERNASGRVSRLRLDGLQPNTIAGSAFRTAIGPATLRSTAFSIEGNDGVVRFTGRGYGHGVGMCAVGAARRARRGETAEAILSLYYPGVQTVGLSDLLTVAPDRP
jgi:stage II sporulation protein D